MTTREDILSLAAGVERPWRYDIQYGPEGEANYAWVYDGSGQMICTTRTHHAANIVEAMNRAAPTPPAAETPGQEPVARFGHGKLVVDFGTVGGVPAVFVAPAKQPGEVGASAKRENQPLDRMIEGEFFMTFPTEEQAKLVADALMNISAPPTYADAEAKRHIVELEQCALFVDSPPLAKSMTDAAAFLRSLASPAPKEPGQ